MNTQDDTPDLSNASDDQLLTQFLAGEQHESFAVLVRRHHRLVLGICERTLGRGQDADDAFQAAFIVLARNARHIRRRGSLASWLYGVAYRIASRIRRERSRHVMLSYQEHVMVSPCPWKTMSEQEDLRQLDAELAKLPDSLREPLALRYLEGLDNESAASILGVSIAALEGRLKRAKARMRTRMLRHGVTLTATLLLLARRQQTLFATDHSTLIHDTIHQVLTTGSTSSGTESSMPIVQRLAQVETVTMHAVRWSKIVGVSAAIVSMVTLPLAVRQVVGQGVGTTARSGPQSVAIELANTNGTDTVDPPTTLRAGSADPFAGTGTGAEKGPEAQSPPQAGNTSVNAPVVAAPARASGIQTNRAEDQIVQALDQPSDLDFVEEPLSNVVDFLSQQYGVVVELDQVALESIQVTSDSAVTGRYHQISLRSSLKHLLRRIGATYTIRDEALSITTPEAADKTLILRLYRVESRNGEKLSLDDLGELIQNTIAPDTWQKGRGGLGICEVYGDSLVVNHCLDVHEQIYDLLQKLEYRIRQR